MVGGAGVKTTAKPRTARPGRTKPKGPKRKGLMCTRVEVVINPLSGSVGPQAYDELNALIAPFGLDANVVAVEPGKLMEALEAAVACKPELVIILAGDGTARAACELCGPKGPLVAPLPGGTMNMLPKALYGTRDWKTALTDILTNGVERAVSGGEIDGHRFYVAAMVGTPALWAKAREAARGRQLQLAIVRARKAYDRAFTSKVRFSLDGKPEQKAEALSILCPLVSRTMVKETALEVAALNPSSIGEALRVGMRALIGEVFGATFGDWRNDPAVDMGQCKTGRARGRNGLPAYIDGEPIRLSNNVDIRFRPKAFRALVPADADPVKA